MGKATWGHQPVDRGLLLLIIYKFSKFGALLEVCRLSEKCPNHGKLPENLAYTQAPYGVLGSKALKG